MKTTTLTHLLTTATLVLLPTFVRAQATFTDDFSTPHDYLTNGVAGTIWDGLYLGASEFANPMDVGMAAGTVSIANAGISSNGVLTVASLQTDWENKSDDGFFLFKIVTGDFDMSVRVVGPIDTRAHHFPGLMVRAFGPGGAPAPEGKENYFLWGRFDEYNIPNMLKNNVNGAKRDRSLGTWPNTNYWLRIQRQTNTFNLFEKGSAADDWLQVGSVTRNDFNALALQVGIEHADYDGGRTLKASYSNFRLTVSNLPPAAAEPAAATGLKINAKADGDAVFTWTPGAGSAGTLLAVWTGSPALKEAPAAGLTYHGNPEFGTGDTLPSTNYYVAYVGSGKDVTVSRLKSGSYYAAAFPYTGAGNSTTYSHAPATVTFTVDH